MNELLLILSLVISFFTTIIFFKLFGKAGLFAWIGICAVFANIEVNILVYAFGMNQTLGNTLFASIFLATDILSEVYGKKEADKGVYVGLLTTVLFIIFSLLWLSYIPSTQDRAMPFVVGLFNNTPRVLISSLLAYGISELLDVFLYQKIWQFTQKKTGSKEKFLWLRNNFSTLVSQLVNITVFNFGAFYGIYKFNDLLSITMACYIIYIITSLLDTPFIYLARKISNKSLKEKKE